MTKANDSKAMMKAEASTEEYRMDPELGGRVIESLVLRGDVSALSPSDRARFYIQTCEGLGLNPHAQPFAFLRLNGKEILYATRGATDQLAAIHRVTREIIDGPKVIDLAGTKLAYCVCRASLPNGRHETSTKTLPFTDPINVLMKCETGAKRRATLSILGLSLLDETELETIPASVQQQTSQVDLGAARPVETAATPATPHDEDGVVIEPSDAAEPTPLEIFLGAVRQIELPEESVSVWMKHRADLSSLPVADRESAWKALCRKTEEVGKVKNAKVWLKKAIAEEDNRRGTSTSDHHAA